MTTEAKIHEAYQKYLKLDIYPTNFCDFEAGYLLGMAEAFEAAAKLVDDMDVEETNYCMQTFEEGKKFQYDAVAAIREMAKEMK